MCHKTKSRMNPYLIVTQIETGVTYEQIQISTLISRTVSLVNTRYKYTSSNKHIRIEVLAEEIKYYNRIHNAGLNIIYNGHETSSRNLTITTMDGQVVAIVQEITTTDTTPEPQPSIPANVVFAVSLHWWMTVLFGVLMSAISIYFAIQKEYVYAAVEGALSLFVAGGLLFMNKNPKL